MSRQSDPPPSYTVAPQTPNRQLRHQSSLEHVFHFTLTTPNSTRQDVDEADFLYHQIMNDCEAAGLFLAADDDPEDIDQDDPDGGGKVYLHDLFRALVEHCPHPTGRANIIRMILHGLFLSTQTDDDSRTLPVILQFARTWLSPNPAQRTAIFRTLETIASDFLLAFFVPLTAQSSCTPRVSALLTPHDIPSTTGTPSRLRTLRTTILARDGYRCVVTGHLEKGRHTRAHRRRPAPPGSFGVYLQAAHIIPHALNSVRNPGDPLPQHKSFVWGILNMFDPGFAALLEGPLIDSPTNVILLSTEIHEEFGRLRCYLDEVALNTYTLQTTRFAGVLSPAAQPLPRVVMVNREPERARLAQLPSRRFLAMHKACAKMMEMAGAAEWVERKQRRLEKMEEEGMLRADGSSDFGALLLSRGVWGGRGVEVEICSQDGIF